MTRAGISQHGDLQGQIRRQIADCLRADGDADGQKTTAVVETFDTEEWASATFEGHRHCFVVRFDSAGGHAGRAAKIFSDSITTADIRLKGELLADLALVEQDDVPRSMGGAALRLRFEALTIAD